MNSLLDGNDKLPEDDDNKNYYDELVGEGKRYKDNNAIAKAKYHQDMTVETLKRQMDLLREDYAKSREENMSRAKLEDLIDRLDKDKLASNLDVKEADVKKPEFDLNSIKSLVSEEIRQTAKAQKEQENLNLVQAKLKERFGDNHQDYLKQQMSELGLDKNSIDSLAKTNPQLLIKSLGLDVAPQGQNFQTPPKNSSGLSQSGPQKRTWAYYQEMKKKTPMLYFDAKNNAQMIKDHAALGTAFEDGDYHRFG